jgi:hypothetical protein
VACPYRTFKVALALLAHQLQQTISPILVSEYRNHPASCV